MWFKVTFVMKKIPFLLVFFLAINSLFAQHNYNEYNRFGITANLTQFNIITDNFNAKAQTGFLGGFQTRGSFYNNFDLVLGLNITSNKLGVEVLNPLTVSIEEAKYDLLAVQLNLLLSYKLIGENLTFELGPVLMYNNKMELTDSSMENYTVNGLNTVTAEQLQDISQFNFNAAVGLTGGFEHFRLQVQYQYGINNILNKLNKQNLVTTEDFKGHLSLLMGGVTFYL